MAESCFSENSAISNSLPLINNLSIQIPAKREI